MGRTIDQDVHAAFVEFKAKDDDKCLSVQCIYCQQTRAKNTSRQKQHLLECPGLQNQPQGAQRTQASPENNGLGTSSGYGPPAQTINVHNGNAVHSSNNVHTNGMSSVPPLNRMQETPTRTFAGRPSLPVPPPNVPPLDPIARVSATPKPKPTPKPPSTTGANIPAPPLDDVHAAFMEFKQKEEDKCLSVQCMFCHQIRAKNTSRQRQHLLECPVYLNVMKDSIPANNLLHRFEEGDIARSIALPTPTLELDFRLSIKLNPRINVGPAAFGQRYWLSYIGGQWAGRWGKGVVIPGGQDSQTVVKDLATKTEASYLIQTSDEPPAFITCRTRGWMTGPKDVLERVVDPEYADTVSANQYKWRVHLELESGDERYAFLNTTMFVGSGCKRGHEVIYDAYQLG